MQTKTLQKLLHELELRRAKAKLGRSQDDLDAQRKRVTSYKEPTSLTWQSQHRSWKPEGYYRLFCAHDRPMWEPCTSQTCRRGRKEANANLTKLLEGKL